MFGFFLCVCHTKGNLVRNYFVFVVAVKMPAIHGNKTVGIDVNCRMSFKYLANFP